MKKRISGWGRKIASHANISFPKKLKALLLTEGIHGMISLTKGIK
jgi:hypothetical protein